MPTGPERQAEKYPRRQVRVILDALHKANSLRQVSDQFATPADRGKERYLAEVRIGDGEFRDLSAQQVLIEVVSETSLRIGIADAASDTTISFRKRVEPIQTDGENATLVMMTIDQVTQAFPMAPDARAIFDQGIDRGITIEPNLSAPEKSVLGGELRRLATLPHRDGTPPVTRILHAAIPLVLPPH